MKNITIFKEFKKGLKRQLLGTICPKASPPIDIFEVIIIYHKVNHNNPLELATLVHIFIQFFGIFRISEVVKIQMKDLKFSGNKVQIYIRKTKTDQNSNGGRLFIYNDKTIYDKVEKIKKLYKEDEPESYLFQPKNNEYLSTESLRNRLFKVHCKHKVNTLKITPHSL